MPFTYTTRRGKTDYLHTGPKRAWHNTRSPRWKNPKAPQTSQTAFSSRLTEFV